ncbi:hypothetical protein D7Z26_21800 [Cohnella endophytica]|uniref:Uncharacterized protein n=1 Tax=Cohnella endophytica TaxID=2419778 RepID=A0A494XD84_9BACL|nr:hypothetical protein [Cohnella endophytica]RKP47852.1 hypothetical protein D7Z26_21800 [Cohnella endophytica]
MRSFAIWYSTNDNITLLEKKATIHINLWDKPHEDNDEYCFDFGVLVEDLKDIKSIFLYAPFEVNKNQIKDLGGVISKNRLVNAIFNENFTTTDGEPKRLVVNGSGGKPPFVIYALEIENQVKLTRFKRNGTTPGTIIEIKVENIDINDISRYYFRIRLEASKRGISFINDEIEGVSFLNNQFTNTEIIDFRLNDVRSYSEELKEQFSKGKKFQILAIHYLILRNANDSIIHYGKEINSRILENNLWESYIDGADYTIIAYHIKSKAKVTFNPSKNEEEYVYVEDFSDLSRFQSKKDTRALITKYILGIIGLGALGGVIGNLISKKMGL